MANRSNAASELTRFWLEARYGCLTNESAHVAVPSGNADIDFVALQPIGKQISLPSGEVVGPRLIVEAKDEHDADRYGTTFGTALKKDLALLSGGGTIPKGAKDVKFAMLRQEHFERAASIFGTDDFDRLFVVHAINSSVLNELGPTMSQYRIHWLTIPALVADLLPWYQAHPHPTELRQSLIGDLLHLLVGFCHMSVSAPRAT